jgi:hypothetical protein
MIAVFLFNEAFLEFSRVHTEAGPSIDKKPDFCYNPLLMSGPVTTNFPNMYKVKKSAILGQKTQLMVSIFLIAALLAPAVSLAKSKKSIYVDINASGTQDGTSTHPYKTINDAMDHADDETEIHVSKGIYEENVRMKEGVKIFGSAKSEVIIKAEDDDDAVVTMDDDTEINKVTVRKGRVGVEVRKDDEASIVECIVEDNDNDGIYVKYGEVSNKKKVSISDSIIRDNGRAGIYSQKRRLVIIDNEIVDNKKDGVMIEGKSSAWIEGNRIKDNGGSGMRLVLDGSNIWTKGNTYRENKKDGIWVDAFGGTGRVDVAKSKFVENGDHGVVRFSHPRAKAAVWNGLTFDNRNEFSGNDAGNISNIILVK